MPVNNRKMTMTERATSRPASGQGSLPFLLDRRQPQRSGQIGQRLPIRPSLAGNATSGPQLLDAPLQVGHAAGLLVGMGQRQDDSLSPWERARVRAPAQAHELLTRQVWPVFVAGEQQ